MSPKIRNSVAWNSRQKREAHADALLNPGKIQGICARHSPCFRKGMKTCGTPQRNQAMTLVEAVVVIVVIAFLTLMVLPAIMPPQRKASRILCANNLKQIGLAYKIWAGDHNDKYPMNVSVTNGGTMELMETPEAWETYLVMSNELNIPKTIICPEDGDRGEIASCSWSNCRSNISYFIGMNANETNFDALLGGDDNFEINGILVKPGPLLIPSNSPIMWSSARHVKVGNILLSDGSVQGTTRSSLRNYISQSGYPTNRLIIP
jgi:type II secretory pathway pseudopilin PulG